MFNVNQIATGNLAAASELLDMFQLSRGQGIAWNVETRELFDKPKIAQFFLQISKGWSLYSYWEFLWRFLDPFTAKNNWVN